jgi:hypothetical protein
VGFVTRREDDEDDLGGLLRGQRRGEDDAGDPSTGLDLGDELLRCQVCRRELLPWETTCPDDGGPGVLPSQIAAATDPLLERLLAEEAGDAERPDDPSDDAAGER